MPINLSGLMSTVTSTRTLVSSLELAAPANVTSVTTAAAHIPTLTRPVTTGASIVFNAELNYLKLQTLCASGVALTCYVIGWTFSANSSVSASPSTGAVWIPTLLTKFVATSSVSGPVGVAGDLLYAGQTYVKSLGDLKIYNGETTSCPGGFVIIDVTGNELVELHMVSSGASKANAVIGSI